MNTIDKLKDFHVAHQLISNGANRSAVVRATRLSADQVGQMFERCGRNKFGPVYSPEICLSAIETIMQETKV